MQKKLDKFTKEQIENILLKSKSFREVLIKFGYNSNGSGAYNTVRLQLNKLGITIPKYHYYGDKVIPLNEILIENSTYASRTALKKRLISEKYLEYKCECGNTGIWNNKLLVLQLEHINGINNDNRIENLKLLCPNCHSQTTTFGGRNNKCTKKHLKLLLQKKCLCGTTINNKSIKCQKCYKFNLRKVERPPIEQILIEIKELGYCGCGRKYGVSDSAIRKWIK